MVNHVIQSLADFEILIYLILLVAGVGFLRYLWLAWVEWRSAVFGLEKELAQRRLASRAVSLGIILMLMMVEFVLASFVAPFMPMAGSLATPTVSLLITPTGTISAELATALAQTQAMVPPQSSSAGGCEPGRLEFTAPVTGQELAPGQIELFGSVDAPNFGFYKYEVAPQGSDAWATIFAGRDKGANFKLGVWNTSELPSGDYQLRLVVVDSQGVSLPPCVIVVRILGSQ
jgi:hypothetical protein